MRATTRIEQVSAKRKGIVVTALPYGVGPERVIEKIKELVQAKKLEGISDLTDLTDGEHGMHLVIEIKSGFSPEAVRENLYRLTSLEESFNVNNVALVEGQPRTLGLVEMLRVFIDHRLDVVRRRSEYRRRKALDRLHLVEGLLIASLNIDEVVALIRSSDDATIAKQRLIDVFDLTDIQASHILDMPLRRLTKYSRIELETEQASLTETISELTRILDEPKVLRAVVTKELDEAAAAHATPRRTVLLDGVAPVAMTATPLEVPDEPCRVVLTAQGLLARTAITADEQAPDELSSHAVLAVVPATTRGEIALVTSAGHAHRLSVVELPMTSSGHSAAGAPVSEYCSLAKSETPVGLLPLVAELPLVLAIGTAHGVVKRLTPDVPIGKDVWEIVSLKPADRLVGAAVCSDADELVFVSSDAQLLRFAAASVRPQGRAAAGMAGIKLAADAEAVFFGAVAKATGDAVEGDFIVATVAGSLGQLVGTSASSIKVSDWSQFPAKGRATGGVRCQRLIKGEDALLLAWVGAAPVRAETSAGKSVAIDDALRPRDASGAKLKTAALAVLGGSRL